MVEVRGRGQNAAEVLSTNDDISTVVHTAPSTQLAALYPRSGPGAHQEASAGLRVLRDNRPPSDTSMLGWRVPNTLGVVAFMLFLAGFGLLVAGPQPWRATRWAWFWLLLPPIGNVVFLLLSGPTPGVPASRDPRRRLTGGWAFLLSIPLMAVLTPFRW